MDVAYRNASLRERHVGRGRGDDEALGRGRQLHARDPGRIQRIFDIEYLQAAGAVRDVQIITLRRIVARLAALSIAHAARRALARPARPREAAPPDERVSPLVTRAPHAAPGVS